MDGDNLFKRLRGVVGNALVWGATWATLGLVVFTALNVAGTLPPSIHWYDGFFIAARLGLVGGIAGGAFSGLLGLLYRGRRLSDLSAVRFGVGGGIVAGVFVPAFLQAMNVLSGGGAVPMALVLDDGLMAALFGAVAAGGSLKIAQRAELLLAGGRQDRSGLLAGGNPLASAGARDAQRHGVPVGFGAED